MLRLLLALMLFPSVAYAEIGSVESLKGNIDIDRKKNIINGAKQSPIESMDTVITKSNSEARLKFKDSTTVRITPNSRLLIDDFVYDPNQSDASRIALKATLGTIRYASGQIAKNNPQRVAINTPTATISVRGTDFAMSVDEIGRSLIVMLPSCDDDKKMHNYNEDKNECEVGEIKVETPEGFVILNQPFTATTVYSASQTPTPVVRIKPDIRNINNNMLLDTPPSIMSMLARLKKEEDKKKFAFIELPEDEAKVAADNSKKRVTIEQIAIINSAKLKVSPDAIALSDCSVFNVCWNEGGLNHYLKVDDRSKSTIYIGINERQDNTTYTIRQNNPEPQIKITGTGNQNTVKVTQVDR